MQEKMIILKYQTQKDMQWDKENMTEVFLKFLKFTIIKKECRIDSLLKYINYMS